ncbi:MAG: aldo/keto reductase [Chthoniobacterales bacterium]|nr:aldo/keto reductase [Chthoniobacterales bacterium]
MRFSRRSFLKRLAAAATLLPFAGGGLARAQNHASSERTGKESDQTQENLVKEKPVPRRQFGRHADMLSVVGIGGLTLGGAESREEARRIAHRAIEAGINFFENAWDYRSGEAEEWMGYALSGNRDKVFLMTKVCTHSKPFPEGGKEGAMRMLEDSLRRLRTDFLDLWMIHQIENDFEVERAYSPGGVLEALELAKKQGKVRYVGFTGHTNPQSHLKMLEGGFPFDATLMPVSALGALSSRQFERLLMPELGRRKVAVLGMKGFGGSKRAHLHGLVNAEKVLRYSLSYPEVCCHVIGIDKMEYLEKAIAASYLEPMTPTEREAFQVAVAAQGGSRFAAYLKENYRDGHCEVEVELNA